MKCASCGGSISESAKVCGHCGNRVERPEVAAVMATGGRSVSMRTLVLSIVGVVVVAGAVIGGLLLFGGDDDSGDDPVAASTSTTAPVTTAASTVPPSTTRTTVEFEEYGTPDPTGVWEAMDDDGSFMFLFLDRREDSQVFDVLFYDDGVSGCSSTGFRYPGRLDSIGIMQPDGDLAVDAADLECAGGDVVPDGFAMSLHYDEDADVLEDDYGTPWVRGSFWVGVHPWSYFDLCDLGERGTLGCMPVRPTEALYGYADFPSMADAGAEREHAYFQGGGAFVYGFYLPVEVEGTVRLSAVLSSEADFYEGPADWYSDVLLGVNATPLDVVRVRPDDGQGEWYSWEFDASLLEVGVNSFVFRVGPEYDYPNGLCVYGPSLVDGVEDGFIVLEFDV